MPPITNFESKKQKILSHLSAPDEAYSDLSPKGSVDAGVRELCDEINAVEGFVTTSSCAGRIAVYLEGAKQKSVVDDEEDGDVMAASAGGKGGGEWLYVSHGPLDLSQAKAAGGLLKLFGIGADASPSTPSKLTGTRFVHFRFEPMILHILTSSLPNAHRANTAGLTSGFRESGISSIKGSSPTPLVAIRTQGLFLSSIIGYLEESPNTTTARTIKPMVSEEYLTTLVELANRRFLANEERKQRFRRMLLRLPDPGAVVSKESREWEPADERRERKRAEGLRRKEMRQREAVAGGVEEQVNGDDEEDYCAAGLDALPP